MTLFELQAWLGHRSPHSTQHYTKINPEHAHQGLHRAGYFARNVRTIEVLLDRDAVASGAAAAGQPWQHYDLGHGYCTYTLLRAMSSIGWPALAATSHNAVDDHSRLAYTEILADETKETAAAFWQRAQIFFHSNGISVERVLTDNGSCYRSRLWRDTLTDAGITHKRTRPYRTETERREAFPRWLHLYNHHRGHTAFKGLPPASRVPNLSGQYT